jgi:Flp pilus assembly protein TadG
VLRAEPERGSVLALMPAAVLIFLVLGALAVDSALAFLGERSVSNAAAAAANDAAAAAVDRSTFYAGGDVRLDPRLAREVAAASVAAAGLDELDGLTVEVTVAAGAPEVTVTVRARVSYLFSAAVPGGPDGVDVEATAVATAEEG